MKVGLFTDVYYPYVSGVVTAVNSLAKALEMNGCEVYIICINGNNKKYYRDGNVIMIPGVPSSKILYNYYMRLSYPAKAVKIIRDLDLDIIHTHTEAVIGMFGKSMGKKLNVPVVHTMHTSYESCVDYITRGHLEKVGQKGAKFLVTSFLTRTVNEVITPGKKSYDLLKTKYEIKQNVSVLPNGIDTTRLYSENYDVKEINSIKKSLGIKDNDFVVLWVGRLGFEKNIDFLIEAQKKISSIDKDIKLLVVGGGPQEKNLRKLSSDLKLGKSIIFTGEVKNSDVGKYYALGDVFVSASKAETQGLTLIEAMASPLPVVCINDDSFLDVVKDGFNGYIFNDEDEYVNRIMKLKKNPDILNSMIKNARVTSEKYNLENFGKNILKIYNKALKDYRKNKIKETTK